MYRYLLYFQLILISISSLSIHAQTRRYVKENGTGDGTSWGFASGDIQAMINAVSAAGGGEVWVAAGTYRPNRRADNLNTITPGHRNNAFVLKDGVTLYGGFKGGESWLMREFNMDGPNTMNNPSILSGDFNGDDVVSGSGSSLSFTNNSENAIHVVISAGNNSTAVLDGFTITGGNAVDPNDYYPLVNGFYIFPGDGAGLCIVNSAPTVTGCTFLQNYTNNRGGAIHNWSSSWHSTITLCRFWENYANEGAGIFNRDSSPRLELCTFFGNKAGFGAGIKNLNSSSTISWCVFSENVATGGGAGINIAGGTSRIVNSIFNLNTASDGSNNGTGGGIQTEGGTTVVNMTNCVFASNEAAGTTDDGGGAVMIYGGILNGINITFNNNTTKSAYKPNSNAISVMSGHTLNLKNSIVYGSADKQVHSNGVANFTNSLVRGAGMASPNIDVDPLFTDADSPMGPDGRWHTADDGLRLTCGSLAINAGNNTVYNVGQNPDISDITLDIGGQERIQNGTVDMGAYENPGGPSATLTVGISTNPAVYGATDGSIHFSTSLPDGNYTLGYKKDGIYSTSDIVVNIGSFPLTGLGAGEYTDFRILDNGCSISAIGARTLIDCFTTATILPVDPLPLCPGSTVQLNSEVTNAASPIYTWTSTPSGFISSDPNPLFVVPEVASTFTINLKVTDGACENSSTLTVVIGRPAAPTLKADTSRICFGGGTILRASGYTGNLVWSTGAIGPQINVTPMETQTYAAYSVVNGCTGRVREVTVQVMPKPIIAASVTGIPTVLSATGLPEATPVQWYWNGGVLPGQTAPTYSASQEGIYRVNSTEEVVTDVWTSLNTPGAQKVNDISVVSLTTAYAVTSYTDDDKYAKVLKWQSGSGWSSLLGGDNGYQVSFNRVQFISASTGWVLWDRGLIRTTDGGANWTHQILEEHYYFYDMQFVNSTTGWVTGAYYPPGGGAQYVILRTTDGGVSWIGHTSGVYVSQLHFSNASKGYVLANWRELFKTADGGATYQTMNINTLDDLYDVFFIDGQIGWVAGRFGAIMKTTDGGDTWTKQNSGVITNLIRIHFTSSQTGWIAGSGGVLLRTSDGGATWKREDTGNSSSLNAVQTPVTGSMRPGEVWVAGAGGTVFNHYDNEYYASVCISDNYVLSAAPLPVTLLSFTAETSGENIVKLNWSTVQEQNAGYFGIERSKDAKAFAEIAKVSAKGDSYEINSYFHTDETPMSGRSYYRLRRVDLDGSYTYSRIVSVRTSGRDAPYPNPAPHGVFRIEARDVSRLKLTDLLGRDISFSSKRIDDEVIELQPHARLQPGVYVVSNDGVGYKVVVE